jgi:endonuclease/exonuclease/phosphatase family metal-dependent hydrolase
VIPILLSSLTVGCCSLFGSVDRSIIPHMDQLVIKELKGLIPAQQSHMLEAVAPCLDQRLRIISFNMLLNWSESHLDPTDRWENRKWRVMEYIEWAHPDIIGSQELRIDQIEDLLGAIGHEYDYYGTGTEDGEKKGDIAAIFYRKERTELIKGETFYLSETPEEISNDPFGKKNTFTLCHFKDKKTGCDFIVLNTHLAFGNIERRYYEACKLRDFLQKREYLLPLLFTGDFNTFPFRQELDLPFYDGENVLQIIEDGGLTESAKSPLFGHFGKISSTNFCSETQRPFDSEGEPGVILDHIFVSKGVQVVSHGIDPARVDGHFPSDHFPVIVDFLLSDA